MDSPYIGSLIVLTTGITAYLLCLWLFRWWRWLPCTLAWLCIPVQYGLRRALIALGWKAAAIGLWTLMVFSLCIIPVAYLSSVVGRLYFFFPRTAKRDGRLAALTLFPVSYLCTAVGCTWFELAFNGKIVYPSDWIPLYLAPLAPSLGAYLMWRFQWSHSRFEE